MVRVVATEWFHFCEPVDLSNLGPFNSKIVDHVNVWPKHMILLLLSLPRFKVYALTSSVITAITELFSSVIVGFLVAVTDDRVLTFHGI